jgi:hypothetical protein
MEAACVAMCCFRQAGHQQAASAPGTGTIAGNSVHQQGPAPPSIMAQPNAAPQRVQVLIVQARCTGESE